MPILGSSAPNLTIRSACSVLAALTLSVFSGCGGSDSGADSNGQQPTNPSGDTDSEANRIAGFWLMEEIADTTFDDDWSVTQVSIDVSPQISQVFDGSRPRRYADGTITYRQQCGSSVFEIMLGEPDGQTQRITPCNTEVQIFEDREARLTQFVESALSPDGRWLAVEAQTYGEQIGTSVTVVVLFDRSSGEPVRAWPGYTPNWLPDGRVIFGDNSGLLTADPNQDQMQRLLDLNSPAREPAVSPDGTRIAFSHNQTIWVANVDGSNARRAIVGSAQLRHPAWAPDGRPIIAYLATDGELAVSWRKGVFAANIDTGESYAIDLDGRLPIFHTLRGPLSWYQ